MITVKDLNYTVSSGLGELTILKDINFSLETGKSLAITGSSGSGKTTLLGMLAGLDLPSSGEVVIDESRLTLMSEDQRAAFRANNVGFVFQSFHLIDGLTALENVLLPMELAGIAQAEEQAKAILDSVGLANRIKHKPSELSGGEQQRVALARAFACKPKYLFADEPTGNLDSKTGQQIIELLFDLNKQQNTSLVMVTHEKRLADCCDEHLVLQDGKVVC